MGEGVSYPTLRIARRISGGIPASLQLRIGVGRRPPRVVMLWSSRKMRQSRSVISAADFSDQCLRFASADARASRSDATREPRRISDASSSVTRPAPTSRRDWATSAICRRAPSSATTPRSTPARAPRPNASALSCGLSYKGFRSAEVSWSLSQSNLNLNLSLGFVTFFFAFAPPMYCARISSSSRSRARSSSNASPPRRRSNARSWYVSRNGNEPDPTPGGARVSFEPLFRRAATSSSRLFSAAASLSFLLTNDGRADAFASASRFFTSSSRDRGCT